MLKIECPFHEIKLINTSLAKGHTVCSKVDFSAILVIFIICLKFVLEIAINKKTGIKIEPIHEKHWVEIEHDKKKVKNC